MTILRCEAAGRWTDGLIGRRRCDGVSEQPHPHTDISRLKLNTFACRSSSICHLPPVIVDQSSLVRLLLAKSTLVVFNLFVSSFGPSISEFCSESLHFSSATRLETQHWYTERDNERRMEDVVQVEDEVGLFGWIDSINFFPYLYIYFLQDSQRTAFQITSPLSPSSLGDPSLKLSTHLEL
ncbi:hypothetical protein LWI29_010557 [Acer saccharum]|uniref:Uncharacterized protein n=1 Tax=Acer saccharum TaxID=4024 RepID=A0AA39VZA5_ACESA|nr:hypothetical protein LWI29_010557 [Acer saccharum]